MLKYSFLNDYDTKYKANNRDIACFSKSKMKDMYPDGNYSIIGETILKNKKDEIDRIVLGKTAFIVSKNGEHSKLLFKVAGYIQEENGKYIKLLKRRWLILIILFGLLMADVIAYLILKGSIDAPIEPTPINPEQQQEDEEAQKDIIYISLPTGKIDYRLVNDYSSVDGYDMSLEMNHDNTKDIIHKQNMKLTKDKDFEDGTLDFTLLSFELKVGNYEGKMIFTKDNKSFEYPVDILVRSANSGSMTISYSNEVTVNKSNNQISLNYKHDKDATNNVKLQIVLLDNNKQEVILGESNIVKPGKSISKLTLTNSNINTGTYDGYIRLIILSDEGASTNVNTNIEVHITVK